MWNPETSIKGPKGDQGDEGPQGIQGIQGLQGIQGEEGDAGPQGEQGIQGIQGVAGTGITMQGSVPTSGDLPASGNTQGDAYIVQADDSLWIWDGTAWVSGGSIQGPQGAQGVQGIPGAQGNPGAQGEQGIQGIQGPVGPGSPAASVVFTPAGNIGASNVQTAIVELDNEKVAKAGDGMTGSLAISKAGGQHFFVRAPVNGSREIIGDTPANGWRWMMRPGNDTPESGTQVGCDFDLHSYNNSGGYIRQNLNINRDTGNWNITGQLNVTGNFVTNQNVYSGVSSATVGTYYFGNNGTKYFNYDGTNFNLSGGPLSLGGAAYVAQIRLTNTTTGHQKTMRMGGSSEMEWVNHANNAVSMSLSDSGVLSVGSKYQCAGRDTIESGGQYTVVYDGEGRQSIFLGRASVDNQAYYRHNAHLFQGVGGTPLYATLNSAGLTLNGQLNVTGSVYTNTNFHLNSGSSIFFEASNAVYLRWDGSNILTGHGIWSHSNIQCANTISGGYVTTSGNLNAGGMVTTGPEGHQCNNWLGSGNPYQVNLTRGNANWNLTQVMLLHYSGNWAGMRFNGGGISFDFRMNDSTAHKTSGAVTWAIDSDIRVKNVGDEYAQGLDAITALRPVKFTYKHNTSYDAPDLEKEEAMTAGEKANIAHHKTLEYVGLVAQEAETMMPELFTQEPAYIDGVKVEDKRTAEYTPLIFALVNAVKELKARVEALEAA